MVKCQNKHSTPAEVSALLITASEFLSTSCMRFYQDALEERYRNLCVCMWGGVLVCLWCGFFCSFGFFCVCFLFVCFVFVSFFGAPLVSCSSLTGLLGYTVISRPFSNWLLSQLFPTAYLHVFPKLSLSSFIEFHFILDSFFQIHVHMLSHPADLMNGYGNGI